MNPTSPSETPEPCDATMLNRVTGAKAIFERDADGRVRLTHAGVEHTVARFASAFPISVREEAIVLENDAGEEIGILDRVADLEAQSRALVREELNWAYLMPIICNITEIGEAHGVLTCSVDTDRGTRTIEIRNPRRALRKVGGGRMILRDVDGNRYEIPGLTGLPNQAQSLLEAYL